MRIRPSISGSATCIARSEGPSPRGEARQASQTDAREHDLQHRRVERVERRSLVRVEARGKGGGVEHDVEALLRRERRASGASAASSLRLVTKTLVDCKALVAQRARQRFDRLEIAGEIDRAIEDDQARAARPAPASKQAASKRPKALTGTGGGAAAPRADFGGEKGEARRHVVRAALVEIAPDPQTASRVEGRGLVEARVARAGPPAAAPA